MRTDTRCGTNAGYAAHIRRREETCPHCRAAHAYATKRYVAAIELGSPATVGATGTIRRLQALSVAGWTQTAIWQTAGIPYRPMKNVAKLDRIRRTTAARIAEVTEQLWNQPPPTRTAAQKRAASRARGIARTNGWAPLAAWDNIDDPNERPKGVMREVAA